MAAELPERIVVGPFVYRIEFNKQVADAGNCWGRWEPQTNTIYLEPDVPRDRTAVTALHEVLHAIIDYGRIGPAISDLEGLITPLAPLLVDTLRRNPEFVDYLLRETD